MLYPFYIANYQFGERYDQWRKIYNQKSKIVIGARSAIFAPIKNLGIIIIDEEHDMSYKSDTTPRYNTSYVAKCICTHEKIPLVVGSATPSIDTYYKACNKKIELLKLTKRANESNLPEISVVDMKEELESGNKTMFSRNLYEHMKTNLENKEQTILFLNRRGHSTFVMCRDCGFVAKCRNCNISLTYHSKENKLKCHYCGYETNNYYVCPVCKSKNIRYFGAGTQKIEQEVKKIFPNASTIRMDIDTVTTKGSHEKLLNRFKNENIDVLIGTQMVVKGHHFPNVTLVGVLAADTSLNVDDYRSGERTFQTLTQVSGRAGRESLKGRVVIQTYNPDDYSIIYSKNNDFISLYNKEIKIRNQLKYPPFCDIFLIGVTGTDENEVIKTSYKIYDILKIDLKENINIFTPMPAPISKIKNNYRWRLIIKHQLNNNIISIINNMLDKIEKLKLKNTRLYVDVNPNNMG